MIKALINSQGLRNKIYLKAKAEKAWRFRGLYIKSPENITCVLGSSSALVGICVMEGNSAETIRQLGIPAHLPKPLENTPGKLKGVAPAYE